LGKPILIQGTISKGREFATRSQSPKVSFISRNKDEFKEVERSGVSGWMQS